MNTGTHLREPRNVLFCWILISASPMPWFLILTLHHSGTLPRRQVYRLQ